MKAFLRFYVLVMAVTVAALISERPTIWAQADSGQIARGEKVYGDKKCGVCHAIKGKGGKTGPDLTNVGNARDAQWVKTFLKDPKATNPKSKMMPFKGTDEELETLVAYLMSLK